MNANRRGYWTQETIGPSDDSLLSYDSLLILHARTSALICGKSSVSLCLCGITICRTRQKTNRTCNWNTLGGSMFANAGIAFVAAAFVKVVVSAPKSGLTAAVSRPPETTE